jgi:hypothetical protein
MLSVFPLTRGAPLSQMLAHLGNALEAFAVANQVRFRRHRFSQSQGLVKIQLQIADWFY